MDTDKINKIVSVAAALISLATKLGVLVVDLIQRADMTQDDKDALIMKVKKAQLDVPEW